MRVRYSARSRSTAVLSAAGGQRHANTAYPRSMSQPRWATQVMPPRHWPIVLLAVGVFAALAWSHGLDPGGRGYWQTLRHGSYGWALAGSAVTFCLAGRRRYPLQTWAVVTLASGLLLVLWHAQAIAQAQAATTPATYQALSGLSLLVLLTPPAIALHATAVYGSRGQSLASLALSVAVVITTLSVDMVRPDLQAGRPGVSAEVLLLAAGALIVAWALGERAHANKDTVTALAERAAALEAGRAERERAAATEERTRIAAELHDIIAHHVSFIALQAGAARTIADSGGAPDAELLSGIETASRCAMTEMRHALGIIRRGAAGPAPQPTTEQLPELARQMALAGLTVSVAGSAGTLPGYIDLSVYRIVQEALTNVLRHSSANTAVVKFTRVGEQLEVSVTDPGPSRVRDPAGAPARPGDQISPTQAGGYGLIGLRERVRRIDGDFHAGVRVNGGYQVRAVLTIPQADQTPAAGQEPAAAGHPTLHAEISS
jgi:signal transduction histidine kinase